MYQMQIKLADGWVSVRPSGDAPYEYETPEAAASMLRICYPDQFRMDRLDRTSDHVRILDTGTEESLPAWRFV